MPSMAEIIGLGIDATDIDRIAETLERYGERFMQRIFTSNEIAYCTRRRVPAIHFAGRFAAKEAAMKALGTGHSQNVLWRDVEVIRRGGPPQLQFHGGAGYIEEMHIARAWRDQRLLRIGGGTTETMRYYVAKLMGL